MLETFDNPSPGRDYEIVHTAHEFTSLCPLTGQPVQFTGPGQRVISGLMQVRELHDMQVAAEPPGFIVSQRNPATALEPFHEVLDVLHA